MIDQPPRIYSPKLTVEQNAALARYEAVCGMEPIGLEAFEAGEINAYQLWQSNMQWMESVWMDVQNIAFPAPIEEAQAAWAEEKISRLV